jgi:hypothetical protein
MYRLACTIYMSSVYGFVHVFFLRYEDIRSRDADHVRFRYNLTVQLIRFLVMKLTHLGSNLRFDMCIVFMDNYSISGRRHPR